MQVFVVLDHGVFVEHFEFRLGEVGMARGGGGRVAAALGLEGVVGEVFEFGDAGGAPGYA